MREGYYNLSTYKRESNIPILLPSSHLDIHNNKNVHILASGNSITQVDMLRVSKEPCIFVNGSIQLCATYSFIQPIAYVISDPRFIEHNISLMKQYYNGQCSLYITQAVLKNLEKIAPDYVSTIQSYIRIIYNFQKPITQNKSRLLDTIVKKIKPQQINTDYIKLKTNTIKPIIGVSIDIRHGFVEAGTVAFVATQLAYSMGFSQIYIHGMDLLNTSLPRFYEDQSNKAPCKIDKAVEDRIVPSFDFLAQVYNKSGILVYNGSPVSKDLFKHLTFQKKYL